MKIKRKTTPSGFDHVKLDGKGGGSALLSPSIPIIE